MHTAVSVLCRNPVCLQVIFLINTQKQLGQGFPDKVKTLNFMKTLGEKVTVSKCILLLKTMAHVKALNACVPPSMISPPVCEHADEEAAHTFS